MVVATRNVFGMDWRYGIDCQTANHASLEVSAEQSVRLQDPSVIVVPTLASHQSLQDALDTFFATGSGSDLAFGNAASPCPYCAESLHRISVSGVFRLGAPILHQMDFSLSFPGLALR